MFLNFFSRNGKIFSIEKAVIPLSNLEYQYGFGVYETIKVRKGIIYFADQHIKRLLNSAQIIRLNHKFSHENILSFLKSLLELFSEAKMGNSDNFSFNFKVILIGGKLPDGAQIFILPLPSLFLDKMFYKKGVKTLTTNFERIFPNAKTLNMLGSFLAHREAKENGCYDALLLNSKGNILEGTKTNFFTIKKKTIFTPESRFILEGVTRYIVLNIARKNGFTIKEEDISLLKIQKDEYEGAFLTSTSAKIIPINQIDDIIFPEIPEAINQLIKLHNEFLEKSRGIFLEK